MQQSGKLSHLLPFFVFVGLFFISTIWLDSRFSPIFACLLAIVVSFFTFAPKIGFNKKVDVFISGCANPVIVAMSLIFIESSMFTYILKLTGSTDAAVRLGMCMLPCGYLLPGFFLITAIFATAIGSSMGTIAAFLPIGIGIAQKIGIPLPLMAGTVVGAAMLGDNLSLISDTTIAATKTTGSKMHDKFKANFWLVSIAAVLTLIVLTYINAGYSANCADIVVQQTVFTDLILIIPYLLVLLLALCGLDVVGVLAIAILVALGIGVALGKFSFLESTMLPLEGFAHDRAIDEVLILAFLIAGLSKIVEFNGGLSYLLSRVSRGIKSKGGAEVAIAGLIFLVNAVTAINTVAILVTGPIAHRIGQQFGIQNKRVACLLDIFSCICQGILPYAPQLLLAQSIAQVTSVSIIPYLYYQGFIFIVMIFSITRTFMKEKKKISVTT